jgi:hypothetical protein
MNPRRQTHLNSIPLGYVHLVRTPEQDELARRIVTEGHTEETKTMVIRAEQKANQGDAA